MTRKEIIAYIIRHEPVYKYANFSRFSDGYLEIIKKNIERQKSLGILTSDPSGKEKEGIAIIKNSVR